MARARIIAICLALAATCPNVTSAQDNKPPSREWVGIGPDSGSIKTLAIDPQNPKILYAGTPAGLFKSMDGAATWQLSNFGLPVPTPTTAFATQLYAVISLAIDPQTPSTIYAGVRGQLLYLCLGGCNILLSGGIFKSTDSGATWNALNVGLEGEWFLGSLTIDPRNPTTVYAATYHVISGATCTSPLPCPQPQYAYGVYKSLDGGANWYRVSDGLPAADAVSVSLAIDPHDPDTLYNGTTKGIFKSTNGGSTWNAALSDVQVCCINGNGVLVVDPTNHDTVYARTTNGILKTTDGGGSWYTFSTPSGASSLAIDPDLSNTLYATASYGPSAGIFKSVDGGVSWSQASPESDAVALLIDPSDSNTIYAGTGSHGVLKTTDAGSSWAFKDSGFKQTFVLMLAPDPQNTGALYTSTRLGVLKTADQGINWSKADSGLLFPPEIRSLVTDHKTPGTVYALIQGGVGYGSGGSYPAGQPGVFKSTDGGTTWTMTSSGLEGIQIGNASALLVDPQDPNTIYLTNVEQPRYCCSRENFRSMDGGINWAEVGFGNRVLMAIDQETSTTLYASSDYGTVSNSTDGGATWSDVSLPPEALPDGCDDFWTPLISVNVDPRNSSVVYAAGSGGLFKSTDGGASWQTMNSGLSPFICTRETSCYPEMYWVGSLIIDPQDSQTLYALTTGGVLRSADGGVSWSAENKGLPPPLHYIGSLAIHPKDSTVYAATDDGVYAITFRP